MSSIAPIRLVTLVVAMSCPAPLLAQCTTADQAAAAEAAVLVARDDVTGADDRLRTAFEASRGCDELAMAAWSIRGWRAARAAGASGGRAEDVAPVGEAIGRVSPLGPSASPAGYAVAVLRAAAAAAQDERDELRLWLDHARDLTQRLTIGDVAPRWPLPIDLAEGQLWLEVDDFELAEEAFSRAPSALRSPASWGGLARAFERQGKAALACDAYRGVVEALGDEQNGGLGQEARGYLRACTG